MIMLATAGSGIIAYLDGREDSFAKVYGDVIVRAATGMSSGRCCREPLGPETKPSKKPMVRSDVLTGSMIRQCCTGHSAPRAEDGDCNPVQLDEFLAI